MCLLPMISKAQTDIKFDIKHYPSDTMIFGYYMADRLLVYDTLYRQEDHLFHVIQDTAMKQGIYIMVSVPQDLFFYQVIVDDKEQDFLVVVDSTSEATISFSGSQENGRFYGYLDYIKEARLEIENIDKVLSTTDSTLVSIIDQLQKDKVMINAMVQREQERLINEYPESITALLLKSNLPFEFPAFDGSAEEIEEQRFNYYRDNYFKNIDLHHPAIIRTPFIHDRMKYYEEKLTYNIPDSIIKTVDYLLGSLPPDSEIYQFYLSYFLNKYANSPYIGMDAVYVHLALEYYAKGKAPWMPEENKREIVSMAQKMKPVLIGKQAPDFRLVKQDGTPVVLSELDNEYTVVVFWKPSCGHCTKAMPDIIAFQEAYKDQDIQVVAICTDGTSKPEECWQGVKDKNMESLTNLIDASGKDRVVSKYYAISTPLIYFIDREGKIAIKKVPAENMGAVIESLRNERARDAEQK